MFFIVYDGFVNAFGPLRLRNILKMGDLALYWSRNIKIVNNAPIISKRTSKQLRKKVLARKTNIEEKLVV